jgi:hypothetical protein
MTPLPVRVAHELDAQPQGSSSMRWRSGVMASPFPAARTAQNRVRLDVTRRARVANPCDHARGYPPKAD